MVVRSFRGNHTISDYLSAGDGAIFNDELLKRGDVGGGEAARLLKDYMIEHLLSNNSHKPQVIKAIIYMNAAGLGKALERHDICTSSVFRQFVLGFNQATPLFAIIDVGMGKEAADTKLKGSRKPPSMVYFYD